VSAGTVVSMLYALLLGWGVYFWLGRWWRHWKETGDNPLRLVVGEFVYVCAVTALGGVALVPLSCSQVTVGENGPRHWRFGMKAGFTKVGRGDHVTVELRTKDGKQLYLLRVLALPGDRVAIQSGTLVRNGEMAPDGGKPFPEPDGTIFPAVVPDGYLLLASHDPFDLKATKAVAEDADYDKRIETMFRNLAEKIDATCILAPIDALRARGWFEL
jgi:Signal peptidase, peptidase S26